MTKKAIYMLCLLLSSLFATAQSPAGASMADEFRSQGKIYVVIAVLAIIFLAIIVYMISLDLKLRKVEKKIND